MGGIFLQNLDPEKSLNTLQHQIQEMDDDINHHLQLITGELLNSPDSLFIKPQLFNNDYGFVFLITEKDSLIFWSDNSFPLKFLEQENIPPVINTGNAFYRVLKKTNVSYTIFGLYLLKYDYPYENDYLQNAFNPTFDLPGNANLALEKGEYNLFNSSNQFLFSIHFIPFKTLSSVQALIILFLYLFTILFFLGFIYEVHLLFYLKNGIHFLFIAGFVLDVIIIRFVLYFFKLPTILYHSDLFSPKFYAYSDLIPSIGDLFLHVVFLLVICFFLFNKIKFNTRKLKRNKFYIHFIVFTLFMHIFIFFGGITFLFKSLVIDSKISLDLNNIFSLSGFSVISFLILAISLLAYFLVTSKLAYFAFRYSKSFFNYILLAVIVFLVFFTICLQRTGCDLFYSVFIFFYIISFWFFYKYKSLNPSLSNIIFYILFFSLISTYSLHKNNDIKETEFRKLLAVKLSSEQRDPLAEYLFTEIYETAISDLNLKEYLNSYLQGNNNQDSLTNYIRHKYFSGYWKKFDSQFTICSSEEFLIVQPNNLEVNCFSFFDNTIKTQGKNGNGPELCFINYAPGDNGYLAKFNFIIEHQQTKIPINIYIELTPKVTVRNLGFPDLLVNETIDRTPDLSDYSYAKYQLGTLNKRIGKYFYNISLSHYGHFKKQFTFFNKNGYNHLYYKIDDEKSLIISKKEKTFMDTLAPFSYLFLSFSLFILIVFSLFLLPISNRRPNLNFRTRLQISISSIILFSFIVIGIFTLYYINYLNHQKNKDRLSEKTHSVLVELQHKFPDEQGLEYLSGYVGDLLVKFSDVFFTDINIFSLNGDLISSSRLQIYDENLISRKMDPVAFMELTDNKSSLFIHNEKIGRQGYLSAYIPFVNSRNEVIAFLNLPYFAKENDLKREITSFLVTYINIYVILIALSILISLVISNYIARPIKLIKAKIREVKLFGQNEKIIWKRNDEIGELVTEYNRMIDELVQSAELLARSERESAWREMARQVAHEIKNPLTPMKLSVQYLERTWVNKSTDWETRLAKFTKTMIEQIDTLSAIATEFSDFAKMPLTKKEDTNLEEVIQNTIILFKNYANINISLTLPGEGQFIVYADKEQLLRAFNNLLKNSIQAIGDKPGGLIEINMVRSNQNCEIKISDNGGGIPSELKDKIFSPNFTTKSGGMGLGLAIVKSVFINSGGDISYISREGDGTTFIIDLPLLS